MSAWLALLLAGAGGDYVKVEVRGTLRAGIMAIGAETTGYTVTARGLTWELAFAGGADRARADALDGRTVIVTGCVESRPGVEIRRRTIVTVSTLRDASSPAPSPGPPVEACPPPSPPPRR